MTKKKTGLFPDEKIPCKDNLSPPEKSDEHQPIATNDVETLTSVNTVTETNGSNAIPSNAISLPYTDGFNYYLGDILLYGKQKMQNTDSNNGVTIGMVGSSGAGKSTIIKEVFLEDVFGIRKDKDYIITIFTESPDSDAFKNLPKDVKVDGHGLDEEQINWAYRMNLMHGKMYNFMFILDDVLNLRYQKQLEKMFLIMRNTNITSVVSIQYPNLIPRPIRTSVYYIFCLRFNQMEGVEMAVEYFLSSYIPGKSKEEKCQIYASWAEHHRFYLIDNLNYKTYAVDNNFMCKELPKIIGENQIYTEPAEWEENYSNTDVFDTVKKPKLEDELEEEDLLSSDGDSGDGPSEYNSWKKYQPKEEPKKVKRQLKVQPFIQNKRRKITRDQTIKTPKKPRKRVSKNS